MSTSLRRRHTIFMWVGTNIRHTAVACQVGVWNIEEDVGDGGGVHDESLYTDGSNECERWPKCMYVVFLSFGVCVIIIVSS